MGRAIGRLELERDIAAILKRNRRRQPAIASSATRTLVCGSMAILALGPAPVSAVGLGELRLQSALGQPLRATVPLRLAPGETVSSQCVSVPSRGGKDIQGPAQAQVSVSTSTGPAEVLLQLSTLRPLYEPMYEISVKLDCAGTAAIMRHYVLMLDLPGMAPDASTATSLSPRTMQSGTVLTTAATPPARSRTAGTLAASSNRIPAGSSYRVRAGDSLSAIAARVADRPPNSTWKLAELIFAANPQAFIRGNQDLIKLGSEIRIPDASAWQNQPAMQAGSGQSGPAPDATSTSPATTAPPLQSASAPVTAPAVTNDVVVSSFSEAAASTAAGAAIVDTAVEERTAASSPFADEAPASAVSPAEVAGTTAGNSQQVMPAVSAPPVTLAAPAPREVNPLLAVLLGLLLGISVSLLLLRGRVLEGLSGLLRRRAPAADSGAGDSQSFADTDEWLTPATPTPMPAAVGPAAEDTYVVEISEGSAELPIIDSEDSEETLVATPGQTAEMEAFAPPDESGAEDGSDDETMLAALFDDALNDLPAETDLPEEVFMGVESDADEDNALAPTADLPHFNDSAQGFPAEGPTAEFAALDEVDEDPTAGMNLRDLADSASEDTRLSATLQEALSLLERDYESEMTASQVIDREAIENALMADPVSRKRVG